MSTHAPTRTHADAKQMCRLAMGCLSKPLNDTMDAFDLRQSMEEWLSHESHARRFGLGKDDLLIVAIAQRSPLALRSWFDAGFPMSADALLALLTHHEEIYNDWALVGDIFRAPSLAPWHGSLFAHAVITRTPVVARSWIDAGLVSASTKIPSISPEISQWLWWQDPQLRNEPDATLPLHLCLAHAQWSLAELFWEASVDCSAPDGRGMTPLDEVRDYLVIHQNSFASKDDIEQAQLWLARLESLHQAQVLDLETDLPSAKEPPRRL